MAKHANIGVKGRLNNLAYQQLKAMIVSGEVSQEKPLVERTISKQLRMSRTPIKHALSRLQQEGLIRVVPRHGVFPVIITYAEYLNIIAIREVLEGLAARLAVDNFSNAELRDLRNIFNDLGDYHDVKRVGHNEFALANVAFHRSILEHSNNPKLIETVKSLYDHLSLVRFKTIEVTARRIRSIQEHEAIIGALEARNADRAEQAMREHIRALKKDIEIEVRKNPDFFPYSG